jgi:phosphate-selective porin OprO/OprP
MRTVQTKLKKLAVATVAAASVASIQLTLPAAAADSTNAPPDNGSGSNAAQAAEIDALKAEVQELAQKVDALEHQQQSSAPAVAAPSSPSVADLDQKVRILERQREIDQEDAAAVAKSRPKISLGQNGFSFSTADTNFVASFHGVVQVDSRTYFNNPKLPSGTDGFLLRRARPIFNGTVFKDFDFNFTPEFGGSTVQIVDAYLNYRYDSALQLEAGKFKSPVGLEALQADVYTTFNERSIVTDLLPYRDVGVELHGDLAGGVLSYAGGIFNGSPDLNTTTVNTGLSNGKAFVGRLFAQPFKNSDLVPLQGLGFGVAGSYQHDDPVTTELTPGYTTDGQQKFFTYSSKVLPAGTHWRLSPQGYYYYGPFSLLGEYAISSQKVTGGTVKGNTPVTLQNTAWELTGGWVLTGEDAGYNGITPLHPFNLHNGDWGAFQFVARYANLDVDDNAFTDGFASASTTGNFTASASEARAWSVGLNWYLNRNIRINGSFSRTDFTGGRGTGATVTAQPENVLFTRIQLAF